ncbi:MAG: hypothetical protein EZS28_024426 [Streblomastix strix]|uniref:Uncharacterized protein n=1 Tax=Streblomastix strix TaxID=222440 RepID=A0A5J4VC71_9EUKA|nr:MAG: hypothetical protein EZS28_024426 [Streblomastix strix]
MEETDEQATTRSHKKYNINKYKEVERTIAQVEPEEAIQKLAEEQPRNICLSHPNLEVMKFIIDKIWATVTTRKRGDDFIFSSDNFIKLWALITQNSVDDIEIVLEEPLMRAHSCMGKTYKKKDLIRVMDVLVKNVSVSVKVIDNVLWNSIEKLYRINKDFVPLAYGMYEQLVWGSTISQNGWVYGYPIDWTGAIPMDCYIYPQSHVRINTLCQLSIPDDFCVQVCDSQAIYNQST